MNTKSSTLRSASRLALLIALLLIALLPTACAVKPGIVFPALANPLVWPPAPDAPRISYVGQLKTSSDLKPGLSGIDALGQAILGKKDAHSMLTPMAVCTDNADRLFVADSNAQLVHVFNLAGRQYATWQPGKGQPAFSQPVGIAWDAARSRLLVSDSVAAALYTFNSAGQFQGRIGEGTLQRPVGIAMEPGAAGRIFVADAGLHQVLIFSADGKLDALLGSRGAGPGQFNYPTYLAFDPAGTLYVSDSLNFRIQAFDRNLKPTLQFGKKGDMPGYFAQPKGIATDSEGHVYVIDSQFENVQLFDAQGRVLMDFGEEGGKPGQFWLPTAMCIDSHDRIWVADSYNRRVQVFDYKKQPADAQTAEAQP